MPRVSVVLPVYNGAPWVAGAIESIQRQTYPDWELLILDDGSTDGSFHVCSQLAERDPRIRLLRHDSNMGLAAAMTHLCGNVKGEYVAVQEQDDISLPHRLEREVNALDEKPDVGLVSGIAEWLDDDGKAIKLFPGLLTRGEQFPQDHMEMVKFLLLEQCKVVNAACMFRQVILNEIPSAFDVSARMSIDWQFFIRVAHRWKIWGLNEVLVRMRRGSGHRHLTEKKCIQFNEGRRCLRIVYRDFKNRPDSCVNLQLYRQALSNQLVLESRYWGRWRGVALVLQALALSPDNPRAWRTLRELFSRGVRKLSWISPDDERNTDYGPMG
jgi:glycosyltransferase involved in cell wall biosynthesis